MSLPVVIHADAAAELEAAAIWYDDQRDGLGMQFLAAVDRTIQHARAWPQTGTPVDGFSEDMVVRRLVVARFPYHVAYLVHTHVISVLAVAHAHRRPGYWRVRTEPGSP